MSESLRRLRDQIDDLDARLLELLSERALVVLEVQRVKSRESIARVDNPRMEQILDRLVSLNKGPLTPAEIRDVYGELLKFFAHRLEPR
jgi:3-deoxy-7-phosphoheptulonate synthase / chorismate mutase